MKSRFWFCAMAFAAAAAVPSGFQHWSAEQTQQRFQSLQGKMDANKVATETIGSWGNHSLVLAHREANGRAEIHETKTDIMFIRSGEASIVIGGRVPDAKTTEPHEMRGSRIEGGERQPLHAGDVLHIPPRTPHQIMVESGHRIDYYTVKVVAPQAETH
jgi:uncharacterized RmlC-like cupin family protein